MNTIKPKKIIKGQYDIEKQYYDIEVPDHQSFSISSKNVITHNSNLYGTIISMSQDFVGSNNVNLFIPKGNFGSRRDPKSAASARYIFTYLNPVTRYIYRKEDDQILNYLYEDVDQIEPDFYLPIIPTVLVNGTSGIGTGWSTDIPKYNPNALIEVIKRKLKKPSLKYAINPSYRDWDGELDWDGERNTYISHGVFVKTKKGIKITELPIDVSTDKYISILDNLCDSKKIKKYIDNSSDTIIDIEIILNENTKTTDIESLLKLTNNISINNMNVFFDNKIVKYSSAEEMLNTWIDIRFDYYAKRKNAWLATLNEQMDKLVNLYAFIKAVVDGDLVINNRKKADIINDLKEMEFDMINDSYDYLLNIPMYHTSKEKYDEYKSLAKAKKAEITHYSSLEPEDIWISDLDELAEQLKKHGYEY